MHGKAAMVSLTNVVCLLKQVPKVGGSSFLVALGMLPTCELL